MSNQTPLSLHSQRQDHRHLVYDHPMPVLQHRKAPGIYWVSVDICQYNHHTDINLDILSLHHSILRGNQQPQKDSESCRQTQDTQNHTETIFKQILRNAPKI